MMKSEVKNFIEIRKGLNADIKAVMATLKRLPIDVKKERKKILRKAAKPLVASAQAKAPVLKSRRRVTVTFQNGGQVTYYPGNLRLALKTLEFRKSPDVFVGPKVTRKRKAGDEYGKSRTKVDAFYAAMVEFGTSKMPSRPYMRPAYESTKGEVMKIVQSEVAKLVQQFGQKHAK